jgi:hypothetical protein
MDLSKRDNGSVLRVAAIDVQVREKLTTATPQQRMVIHYMVYEVPGNHCVVGRNASLAKVVRVRQICRR